MVRTGWCTVRRAAIIVAVVLGALAMESRVLPGARAASVAGRTLSGELPTTRTSRAPLVFEENRGQTDPRVRFVVRSRGTTAWISPTETVLALTERHADGDSARAVVRMRFVGADEASRVEAGAPLPGRSHYFLGSDPSNWVRDVPQFSGAVVRGVRPGIDLLWYGGEDGRLRYDLVAAPGADAGAVEIAFDGAEGVAATDRGELVVRTPLGDMRHDPPHAFQLVDGERRDVTAEFVVGPDARVRFAVGPHDATRALVIDPGITWSTLLGGSGNDMANAMALDSTGACYVTGWTSSTNFPVTSGYQNSYAGGSVDEQVTKLNAAGTAVIYTTYLGGSGNEDNPAIAVDGSGYAYVVSGTNSTDFPVVSALQSTKAGGFDGFVTKLGTSGSTLAYSTYLGGGSNDYAFGVAVDGNGAAYVVGGTASTDFPTQSPLQASKAASNDMFVAKVAASGASLTYSTFVGGGGFDSAGSVTVDAAGAAYVVGTTDSTDFPTQSPFQGTHSATDVEGVVMKLNAAGSALVYCSYLGGNAEDVPRRIALDASGAAWIAGSTYSTNFPTSGSALMSAKGASSQVRDGFLAKVSASGSALAYSTYLGGDRQTLAYDVAVDSDGAVVVTGETSASNFPIVAGSAEQASIGGSADAFISKFSSSGSTILRSTYLGGTSADGGVCVKLDSGGALYVAGYTRGITNFPLQAPINGSYSGGSSDVFVGKLAWTTGGGGGVSSAPAAPTGLTASYAPGAGTLLFWQDNSADETGFRIERMPAGFSFAALATTSADSTTYADSLLFPTTTYTYRVRAFNSAGASEWSNTATITTSATQAVPTAPKAPSYLTASLDAAEVELAWTDNSADETLFALERAEGGATFKVLATTPSDATGYGDLAVRPGWPYGYRVRALSLQGPSPYSNTAVATVPATFEVTLAGGSLADSVKPGRDKLKVSAAYAVPEGGQFDPRTGGLAIQAGPASAPIVVSIAPGDATWKERKGKLSWKSPKGAAFKVAVVVDTKRLTVTVSASGLDFASAPDSAVRLLAASGALGGGALGSWTEGKPGRWASP